MANVIEIFVFDIVASLKISVLAKKMIRLYGYTPKIYIQLKYTDLHPVNLYKELLIGGENSVQSIMKKFSKIHGIDRKASIVHFKLLKNKIDSPDISKLYAIGRCHEATCPSIFK